MRRGWTPVCGVAGYWYAAWLDTGVGDDCTPVSGHGHHWCAAWLDTGEGWERSPVRRAGGEQGSAMLEP